MKINYLLLFPNISGKKKLHAPRIYCISEDGLAYIQEDLGNHMLLDIVKQERRETALNDTSWIYTGNH